MSTRNILWWIAMILLSGILAYLRAGEHITWSWWWVFSPLWLPSIAGCVFAMVGVLLQHLAEKTMTDKEKLVRDLRTYNKMLSKRK